MTAKILTIHEKASLKHLNPLSALTPNGNALHEGYFANAMRGCVAHLPHPSTHEDDVRHRLQTKVHEKFLQNVVWVWPRILMSTGQRSVSSSTERPEAGVVLEAYEYVNSLFVDLNHVTSCCFSRGVVWSSSQDAIKKKFTMASSTSCHKEKKAASTRNRAGLAMKSLFLAAYFSISSLTSGDLQSYENLTRVRPGVFTATAVACYLA